MTADTLTVTRHFDEPREVVFDAWTTPTHFAAWFGGADVDVPISTVVLDARSGGTWRADIELPDGQTIHWAGHYLVVSRPQRLALTITDSPEHEPGAPLEVDFVSDATGTQMTLVQHGTAGFSAEQYALTEAGYQRFFDALENLVHRMG